MSWKDELREGIQSVDALRRHMPMSDEEAARLEAVHHYFPVRISRYYAKLIQWDDPGDPLRNLIVPSLGEVERVGMADTSGEKASTRMRGLQHKYGPTALLLLNRVCGGYCRFCFRKRIFDAAEDNAETLTNIGPVIDYIRRHTEINNVLLSGGDPLLASAGYLEEIFSALFSIDHIGFVRIGSKLPAFLPMRITEDEVLLALFDRFCRGGRRIHVITHFDHSNELTEQALWALDALAERRVALANQTVLLRGVNDSPEAISSLFNRLAGAGVTPYYLFQCRPVFGSDHVRVPLSEGHEIFEAARRTMSGPAKRARYIMSHISGKLEILGAAWESGEEKIFLRYHQARNPALIGRFFSLPLVPGARWLDDLVRDPRDLKRLVGDTGVSENSLGIPAAKQASVIN